ncbi:hypothetical protein PENTCL1PPCAC_27922, partial [Pristionchus entomophagus]
VDALDVASEVVDSLVVEGGGRVDRATRSQMMGKCGSKTVTCICSYNPAASAPHFCCRDCRVHTFCSLIQVCMVHRKFE